MILKEVNVLNYQPHPFPLPYEIQQLWSIIDNPSFVHLRRLPKR
jgi:hypothetical protein